MANTGCTLRLSVRHTEGLGAFLAGVLLLASDVAAQNGPLRKAGPTGSSAEKIDLEAGKQIRDAAMNHSQIMEMVGELSDVRGPRLTRSPGPKGGGGDGVRQTPRGGFAQAPLEGWGT